MNEREKNGVGIKAKVVEKWKSCYGKIYPLIEHVLRRNLFDEVRARNTKNTKRCCPSLPILDSLSLSSFFHPRTI